MRVLCINAGSSSVRIDLIEINSDDDNTPDSIKHIITYHANSSDHDDHQANFTEFIKKYNLDDLSSIDAIAHRIVHGGSKYTQPTHVNKSSDIDHLNALIELDPLHNKESVDWIKAIRHVSNNVGNGNDKKSDDADSRIDTVATFDTTFFNELPDVARMYALPAEWIDKYALRRYGFHGMAHEYMLSEIAAQSKSGNSGGRLITLQLGSGCSIAAIVNGKPVDTTMGFTPLEGLVMSTRCGDVDAGLLTYLIRETNISADDLTSALYHKSGLYAISHGEKDMQKLLASSDESAKLAVQVFLYRIIKYIGAYVAVMGGVDQIVFGGGIGEHAATIRSDIIKRLSYLSVTLDSEENERTDDKTRTTRSRRISSGDSKVAVWIVSVDEAYIMAKHTYRLLNNNKK